MTYDPNRDPVNPRRPVFTEDNGMGTAIFIGALVLLALVFGGIYFYANDSQRVASDMTINNTPTTSQPGTPANPPATAPSSTPSTTPMRSPPAPSPVSPQQ